jgi:hypothetical protein
MDELNNVIEKHNLKPASAIPAGRKANRTASDAAEKMPATHCPHGFNDREFCIMFNGGKLCQK